MFFFFEFSFHLFQSICSEAFPRFRWYICLTEKSRAKRKENFNFPVTNLAFPSISRIALAEWKTNPMISRLRRWIRRFVETSKGYYISMQYFWCWWVIVILYNVHLFIFIEWQIFIHAINYAKSLNIFPFVYFLLLIVFGYCRNYSKFILRNLRDNFIIIRS